MKCKNSQCFHAENFIFFRYFFLVFTGLIVLGVFNGLVFLPVLLVFLGPPAEVIPNDNGDAIDPPSPACMKKRSAVVRTTTTNVQSTANKLYATHPRTKNTKSNKNICNENDTWQANKKHHQSDLSLSTIAEESGSYASSAQVGNDTYPMTSQSLNGASVFVEPHVVVECSYPSTHVSIKLIGHVHTPSWGG